MKKKPKVWLARNKGYGSDGYVVVAGYKLERRPAYGGGHIWGFWTEVGRRHTRLCAEQFEKVAPKSCHLPPGGGPIEIEITMKKITRRNK
jgi:hypothetical protein